MTPTSAPDKPDIPCACCLHTLDAKWQPPLFAGASGFFYLTCLNEDCGMYGQTLADVDYPPEGMFETYGVML